MLRRASGHTISKPNKDGIPDAILERFEIVRQIGQGAYGLVYQAKDKKTENTIALKKCVKVLTNITDAHRTLREICILTELRKSGHPNVVHMTHAMGVPGSRTDLYLAFEFFDGDMRSGIRSSLYRNHDAVMEVVVQVACGLAYFEKCGLLHRDLKPENLFVDTKTHRIVIGDFGLARCQSTVPQVDDPEQKQSEGTLPYMAPELLLGTDQASYKSDIWAYGVIVGELFCSSIFLRGRKKMDFIRKIMEVTGPPTDAYMKKLESDLLPQCLEVERCIENLEGMDPEPGSDACWEQQFPMAEPQDIDLLKTLLAFDPEHRPLATSVMQHPALAKHLAISAEGIAVNELSPQVITVPLDDALDSELKIDDLRATISGVIETSYSSGGGCCVLL